MEIALCMCAYVEYVVDIIVQVYVCICVNGDFIRMYVCIRTCVDVHACSYVRMCICTCVCVSTYTCTDKRSVYVCTDTSTN